MRALGARPEYGVGVIGNVMPYLYCTAPGYRFRKSAYVSVALAPFLSHSSADSGPPSDPAAAGS